MKLNLNYYKGADLYSDGSIEDDIIEYIKKCKGNYEDLLSKDTSWPVFYHLSPIRQNILSWYPFNEDSSILEIGAGMGAITEMLVKKAKKVTAVELSKKRATAILERCKDAKNLEIIVGNLNDIKFEEKFDYITLIGVLEYAPSFTNTDNPMHDFLNTIKKLLKPNGKILIAIENRMGLKYICGAGEDHTGKAYDGINNYTNIDNVKTLDKAQMMDLLNSLNLNYNFYYPFPDYKFPEIIINDKYKDNCYDLDYTTYYSKETKLLIDESKMFHNLLSNGTIDKFSNSFFIEVSLKKMNNDVEFVKFQNIHRKTKYQLGTVVMNDKVIKYPLSVPACEFLNNVYDNHICLKQKYNCKKVDNKIIFEKINMTCLIDLLLNDDFEYYFDLLINKIKKIKFTDNYDDTIFKQFDITISKNNIKKMHILEKGYLDMTFFNSFIDLTNNDLIFIDQEWVYDNVPIEYIIYRNIRLLGLYNDKVDVNLLYKRYNIDTNVFEKLEKKFIDSIYCKKNKAYNNYKIIDIDNLVEENNQRYNDLNSQFHVLENIIHNSEEEHIKLEKNRDDLIEENKKLSNMYSSLEKERNNLIQENKKLSTMYSSLEEERNNLIQENQKNVNELNKIFRSKFWRIKRKIDKIFRR